MQKSKKKQEKHTTKKDTELGSTGGVNASGQFEWTDEFKKWFDNQSKNAKLTGAILYTINKLENGLGQRSSSPGDGVCEIKGKSDKAFRLYYGHAIGKYFLLIGGFKNSRREQDQDIKKAKRILNSLKGE